MAYWLILLTGAAFGGRVALALAAGALYPVPPFFFAFDLASFWVAVGLWHRARSPMSEARLPSGRFPR
jgi:hypothetical protein